MRGKSDHARMRLLRTRQTIAEQTLWLQLRGRRLQGSKFRRQHPVGRYIADFACLESGLIVELDGSQHVQQVGYDQRRSDFLQQQGFRVIRFWNDDVLLRMEMVLEAIVARLAAR